MNGKVVQTHQTRGEISRLISRNGLAIRVVSFCAVAVLLLNQCAVNPVTGNPNFVTMSQKQEIKVGEEEHAKVMQTAAIYPDTNVTVYVNAVGQRVAAESHRPDLKYTFTVIDSPEINAFALPGGYVYINRGLLMYLNSEAELAAVLGHEIGHITARHAVQRQAGGGLAKVALGVGGIVTAVATGSGYIGSQVMNIGSLYAQAGLSGFGREQELEADTLGAEYLVSAGYDPEAVINVVTVLKNQEDFDTKVANQRPSYHGVFATHPRNDRRLREAINSVGKLSASEAKQVDQQEFRGALDGLIVGESRNLAASNGRNRYYQELLGYTMVFPDSWAITETTTTVSGSDVKSGVALNVEVRRLQESKEPRLYLREDLNFEPLQKSEALQQFRLIGYTGIVQENGSSKRVAVIYMGARAYIFSANLPEGDRADETDRLLLSSIRSFRAIQNNERVSGNERRVRYVQVAEGFTFSELARMSSITPFPEETLRLINGYYPIGSPETGAWIKVVE